MFYKTNKPEAVQALQNLNDQKIALIAATDAFCAEYDAEPVIENSATGYRFVGFKFKNPSQVNFDVWTKPARNHHMISSLRVKPLKKEFRHEWEREDKKLKSLREKYLPEGGRVDKTAIYKSLGFDWGQLFFNRFGCFLHNGFIYIDSTLKIEADEILGSEYEAAKAEFNKSQGKK